MLLNGLDLFSGIGGLTLALSPWVKPVAYCENDRYAQSVLLSRMSDGQLPVAPIWDDVRTFDAVKCKAVPIEIIYGGFPCQGISLAGVRKGMEDERSKLFWEVIRLSKEVSPYFVFLENVWPGIRPHVKTIRNAFNKLGYRCRDGHIAAGLVGANHKRDRWFFLAYTDRKRLPLARRDEIEKEMENWYEPKLLLQEGIWGESSSNRSRMDDGIRPRIHRIKCSGNAVVPKQAQQAFMKLMGLK